MSRREPFGYEPAQIHPALRLRADFVEPVRDDDDARALYARQYGHALLVLDSTDKRGWGVLARFTAKKQYP